MRVAFSAAIGTALRKFRTGAWLHFENGSSHAPVILNDECWCLVREVGTSRFHGPFGWFQRLFAS